MGNSHKLPSRFAVAPKNKEEIEQKHRRMDNQRLMLASAALRPISVGWGDWSRHQNLLWLCRLKIRWDITENRGFAANIFVRHYLVRLFVFNFKSNFILCAESRSANRKKRRLAYDGICWGITIKLPRAPES